jgi:hypothetical protein
MVFGALKSVLYSFLKFSMRLLFNARVALPSAEEIGHIQDVVRSNYLALDGVWCVMDGLKSQSKEVETNQHNMHTLMGGFIATLLVVCLYLHHQELSLHAL